MILMLAPGANMTFGAAPSGAAYVSDNYGLVKITNDSGADQSYLRDIGCYTLTPFGGWGNSLFTTLADLYAADTGALLPGVTGYPMFSPATITTDGSNTGTWAKTGSGSGAGNWTHVSTDTFFDAANSAGDAQNFRDEAEAYAASAGASLTAILSTYIPIFADDPYYGLTVFANDVGSIVFGLSATGQVINEQVMWSPVFADDPLFGQSIIADVNGRVVLQQDTVTGAIMNVILPAWPVFADDPFFGSNVIVNQAGTVLSSTATLVAENYREFTAAILPDGVYVVGPSASTKISTPLATAYGASLRGDIVRWSDGIATDGSSYRRMDMNGLAALASTVTTLNYYPMIGQSLADAYAGYPIITSTPPSPNMLAFGGLARPMQDSGIASVPAGLVAIQDPQFAPLAPLYERVANVPAHVNYYGETQGGGFAVVAGPAQAARSAGVFATFGVGGASVGQISKGTIPYQNLLRSVERLNAWCKLTGRSLAIPFIPVDIGESAFANGQTASAFIAALTQLQADLTTDLNAITGGSGDIPLLMWQPSSAAFYGNVNANASYADAFAAMVDLEESLPTKFGVIGPQYWNSNYVANDVHMIGAGYRQLGEMIWPSWVNFKASGNTGNLKITGVSNIGAAITITTNASSQLVLDTTLISDPGQNGLVLIDDTDATNATKIALSSIAVSGTNKITATAATALTAGRSYSIGSAYYINASGVSVPPGPTSGHRSNFRDSNPATFSSPAGGANKYNWLVARRFHFTAA